MIRTPQPVAPWLRLLSCFALLASSAIALAQMPQSTGTTPSSLPASLQNQDPNQDATLSSPAFSGRNSLTADQISDILQDKPEAVVEVKQLTAQQLQLQGLKVDADQITDEVLYNQIASSPPLRTAITNFLRARGYTTDQATQRSSTSLRPDNDDDLNLDDGDDTDMSSRRSLQSLSQLPGSQGNIADELALDRLADPTTQFDSAQSDSLRSTRSSTSRNPTPSQLPQRRTPNPTQPRETDAHNTTDIPRVLRQPAPYNLQSMRDLYTQIPQPTAHLKRFGSEVFLSRTPQLTTRSATPTSSNPLLSAQSSAPQNPQSSPLDIPIGPDYVVGPGDSLTIDLWGGLSQTLTRIIDREGRVSLPESGTVQIAGLTLERAQTLIADTLKQQYRNAQVSVTLARLRTVRVYVVGDVQRPGAYDISSLSTPLNALYAAGGPTAVGSLRTLRHMRGDKLIAQVDLYDFLIHGVRTQDDRFQGGDTLLIPPAGPQVAVSGAVKRPAIYELAQQSTLAAILEDAGGATVAAALNHITIDRIDANQRRETITLDPATSLATFPIHDGDRINLSPILPFSERVVYLDGHVVRPGRQPWRDGMRLNDVLHSYQDLLPEPAAQGEIIRLIAPDLHAEAIEFNVADALIGNANLDLQPFDTIRIRGRYEVDSPQVTIRGEVLHPGHYPLSDGMTAAQLVRIAGGFKRDALEQDADLTSYHIVDDNKVVGQRSAIRIGDAVLRSDRTADATLKPGDILTVHQITGWEDIGASITIEGEAAHPGSYGFQEGERLSSLLRRAGGLRDTAYPEGAVLLREQVRTLEEKSRAELIRQIETSSAAARLAPNLSSSDSSSTLQLIQQQQDQVVARLRSQPASGRLVIRISADINSWAGTDADIEVRRGDILNIPKRPGFVLVSGQVYNASAITFVPGKSAAWYLQHAGGSSELANRKEIFIIRANGTVVGRHSNAGKVLSAVLDAGDVVVVPQKIVGASQFWKNLLTTAQIASSVAITAVVGGL